MTRSSARILPFRRLRDGQQITRDFALTGYLIQLYDVLVALSVVAEMGPLGDPRCSEGIDLLQGRNQGPGRARR